MERIIEHEIFASVLWEPVNPNHLNRISVSNGKGCGSYSDCNEFVISCADFCEDPYFFKLYKITDSVKKHWDENNIDFRIYIYLNDLRIVGGHIIKYRELNQSGHDRSSGYETDPTQQELRIVKRIMSFVLEKQ